MRTEGLSDSSNWTTDDYRAYMELQDELEGKQPNAISEGNSGDNSENDNDKSEKSGDKSEKSGDKSENDGNNPEFNISTATLNIANAEDAENAEGIKEDTDKNSPENPPQYEDTRGESGEEDEHEKSEENDAHENKKPKDVLMARIKDRVNEVEEKHPELIDKARGVSDYLRSNAAKGHLNNIGDGLHEAADSLYLDGAPQKWKQGSENRRQKLKGKEDQNLRAFVNNKNNINYMKNEHGLTTDQAKSRLEKAVPFLNRGITDVAVVDNLISKQEGGLSPNGAIRAYSNEIKAEYKAENIVNDQSKISAIAQIIADRTGESADSPKVQQQATATMQQAIPYAKMGEKDPETLLRLVELEKKLEGNKTIPQQNKSPKAVADMDRIIGKALQKGLSKIEIPSLKGGNEQARTAINNEMNKELGRRRGNNTQK